MSGPERPAPAVETTHSLKRKHFSADDQDDLDALDDIFKRTKTAVPRNPYILSTPSLNPYRYHSQQEAYAWMLGRLWRHDEEHMQYRTYLYREPCQDCFELQAGEDDEPEPERAKTQASNASTQPAKRKPNLSGFKVKQANGTVTPSTKTGSPKLAPTKHIPDQPHEVKKVEKHSAPASKPDAKSPKHTSNGTRDDRKAEKSSHYESRPRPATTSQKSEPASSKTGTDKPDPSGTTPHGLPPLLSPVPETFPNPYGLPTILSPTLPTNIQEELDRLDVQRKRAESNASTSSSDRKSQTLAVPVTRPQKTDGPPKPENRIRAVSMNGASPNPAPAPATEETDSSLVVKLKFSKAKAPTVKQILKLPPRRTPEEKERPEVVKKVVKEVPTKITEGPVIKKKAVPKIAARRGEAVSQASNPPPNVSTSTKAATAARPAEKRPRTDDDATLAVPSKRPRALSQQDRPSTPLQQAISSPNPAPKSSAQKTQPQFLTPKKDARSASMLRTASTESHDSTPGRSGATPAGTKLDAKAGPTSAPLTGRKQADITLLAQTSMKLNQMGRALKHEATKILTAAGKVDRQDEKRAAVTNLECILSYMAAYYAQDLSLNLRGRAGEVEQTWKTLLPLCLSYARCTKDFPHLDGLRSYLSAIIASAICTHVAQRGSNTRPHDSPHDIAHAELAKQHTSNTENFALIADHVLKMNRHYQEARVALPMDELQSMYRKTYAAREPNARLIREPEKVSGARMSGPYFLPISTDTTPIQAVRFGLRFLAEYCEKEKIVYALRVNLDKPE